MNQLQKDLEKLKLILIKKGIITKKKEIGEKQFVKYF